MLKFQRTIIFCVLFAAVWVQSTKAVLTLAQQIDIEHLEDFLNRVNENRYLIPKGSNDHFNSWVYWGFIKDSVKLRIASEYKKKLVEKNLHFGSGTDGNLMDKLAILAYEALDEEVKDWLRMISKPIFHSENERKVIRSMQTLAKLGLFLEYMAFPDDGPETYLLKTFGHTSLADRI